MKNGRQTSEESGILSHAYKTQYFIVDQIVTLRSSKIVLSK